MLFRSEEALVYWKSVASDADAVYDDVVVIDGSSIEPMVTWGITPAQSVGVNDLIPPLDAFPVEGRGVVEEAYEYMLMGPGTPIAGTKIDVVFIGSCTNGRLEDLKAAASIAKGRRVASHVRALVVPGSQKVQREAEALGLDKIFKEAGFEWREAGCSMCLAMNPDKLVGRQISASTSNRNFKGRQGSPSGRTLLVSPIMAAAAAVAGEIVDVRKFL